MKCPRCDCLVDDGATSCWRCRADWSGTPVEPVPRRERASAAGPSPERKPAPVATAGHQGGRAGILLSFLAVVLLIAGGVYAGYKTFYEESPTVFERAARLGVQPADLHGDWHRVLTPGSPGNPSFDDLVAGMKARASACGLPAAYLGNQSPFTITTQGESHTWFVSDSGSSQVATIVGVFADDAQARQVEGAFGTCVLDAMIATIDEAESSLADGGANASVSNATSMSFAGVSSSGRAQTVTVAGTHPQNRNVDFAVLRAGRAVELVLVRATDEDLGDGLRDQLLHALAHRMAGS